MSYYKINTTRRVQKKMFVTRYGYTIILIVMMTIFYCILFRIRNDVTSEPTNYGQNL